MVRQLRLPFNYMGVPKVHPFFFIPKFYFLECEHLAVYIYCFQKKIPKFYFTFSFHSAQTKKKPKYELKWRKTHAYLFANT